MKADLLMPMNSVNFILQSIIMQELFFLYYFVAQIMLKEFFITDIPRGDLVDSVSLFNAMYFAAMFIIALCSLQVSHGLFLRKATV
jgi:hypothetical protein